ncbi:MAG: hypothetical protein ACRDN1_13105 [Trebonia sp.]
MSGVERVVPVTGMSPGQGDRAAQAGQRHSGQAQDPGRVAGPGAADQLCPRRVAGAGAGAGRRVQQQLLQLIEGNWPVRQTRRQVADAAPEVLGWGEPAVLQAQAAA